MKSLDEMGVHVGSVSGRVPRDIPIGSAAWDCEPIGWGPLRSAKNPTMMKAKTMTNDEQQIAEVEAGEMLHQLNDYEREIAAAVDPLERLWPMADTFDDLEETENERLR